MKILIDFSSGCSLAALWAALMKAAGISWWAEHGWLTGVYVDQAGEGWSVSLTEGSLSDAERLADRAIRRWLAATQTGVQLYGEYFALSYKQLKPEWIPLLNGIPVKLASTAKVTEEAVRFVSDGHVSWTKTLTGMITGTSLGFNAGREPLEGVRVIVLEEKTQRSNHGAEHLDDEMVMLETTIDDMNPEWYPHAMNLLFTAGANDVYLTQGIGKKNRPVTILHVLASVADMEKMESIIFRECTTLGVRRTYLTVHRLGRTFISVPTPWGDVRVKVARHHGRVVQAAPEYDDCAALARTHQVPLKAVYEAVQRGLTANQQLL